MRITSSTLRATGALAGCLVLLFGISFLDLGQEAEAGIPGNRLWRVRELRTADTVRAHRPVRAIFTPRDERGVRLSREAAYCVVHDSDAEAFAREVTLRLNQGYELRGELHTERTGPTTFVYMQNMVRERTF